VALAIVEPNGEITRSKLIPDWWLNLTRPLKLDSPCCNTIITDEAKLSDHQSDTRIASEPYRQVTDTNPSRGSGLRARGESRLGVTSCKVESDRQA
jgi:hypothetical protein